MPNLQTLKALGTTNERLREIFTAVPPKQDESGEKAEQAKRDHGIRKKMEEWFQKTVDEAAQKNLKSYQLYAACDVGFDTTPVQPYHVPLNLYAQGKISISTAASDLASLGAGEQFVKKDESGNTKIDAPAFSDFVANLVRFVITRRLASRVARFSTLWPYWKYESRATGAKGKMYAEFVSQMADVMADDFGHRELVEQSIRSALMYAFQVSFQRCSWEVYEQGKLIEKDGVKDVEKRIERQGISFENPHVTRIFGDTSKPLSAINQDDMDWIGYWNTIPYRHVADNPAYYNTDSLSFSPTFWDNIIGAYSTYNQQYLSVVKPTLPAVAVAPSPSSDVVLSDAVVGTPIDPSSANDQKAQGTLYTSSQRDQSVLISVVYKKINPVHIGCGRYPFPVWVRFTVAGNNGTVIHAEFMPSRPAAFLGIDFNSNRAVNSSLAMQAMPFQEQISRLVTMSLMSVISENVKVFVINRDAFKGPEGSNSDAAIANVRKQLEAAVRFNDPVVIEASFAALKDLDVDLRSVVQVVETRPGGQTAATLMDAAFRVLHLMERLLGLSSAEQGQAASHEISATESANIEGTREEIGKLYDTGIDSYRAAMKRIIYESMTSCWEGPMVAPILSRFPKEVIDGSDFKIVEGTEETYPESTNSLFTLSLNNPSKLEFSAIFTSRDGGDRMTQIAAANQLVQTLQYLTAFPEGMQALGRRRFYLLLNEIFRATNVDVVFEMEAGEEESFGQSEMKQMQEGIMSSLQEIETLKKQNLSIQDVIAKVSPELATAIQAAIESQQQQTPPQ